MMVLVMQNDTNSTITSGTFFPQPWYYAFVSNLLLVALSHHLPTTGVCPGPPKKIT